jgi:predicted SAM-dependent methyltransferase
VLRVHLCCGRSRIPGWLNVDIGQFGQEVVLDLNTPWTFAESGSVDLIYCKDGVEHMASVEHFLGEAARVLKAGARLHINVPHFRNPSAHRLTHHHLFSWSYWAAFPEAHDATQTLRVIANRLTLYDDTGIWRLVNALVNLSPKWWERLFYASNCDVVLERRPGTSESIPG